MLSIKSLQPGQEGKSEMNCSSRKLEPRGETRKKGPLLRLLVVSSSAVVSNHASPSSSN